MSYCSLSIPPENIRESVLMGYIKNGLKRDSDTGFFSVNFTKFFRTHNSVFFQTISKNIPQKSLTNKRTCPCSKPVIKKMNLGAYCIFAAGGALAPTQEKKNLGVY